jgi:D-alanyl-D-alanine carboxypeptidase
MAAVSCPTLVVAFALICAVALVTPAAGAAPSEPRAYAGHLTDKIDYMPWTDSNGDTFTGFTGALEITGLKFVQSSSGAPFELTAGKAKYSGSGVLVDTETLANGGGTCQFDYSIDQTMPLKGSITIKGNVATVTVSFPEMDSSTSVGCQYSLTQYLAFTGEFPANGDLKVNVTSTRKEEPCCWGPRTDKWTGELTSPCEPPSKRTGAGWDGLTSEFQDRLNTMYDTLDSEGACYQFTVGYRSTEHQQDLYDHWHEIADHHQNEPGKVCQALHAAGFAQCPRGWAADGIALGGPAKPGRSRHEFGEAADITVKFPPNDQPNVARFRAAAAGANLCGPPNWDPVHVEMPYKLGKQTAATCHI